MSAESTLYTTLKNASGVTTLVSTRIYPDYVPQDKTLPAIAYTRESTEPIYTVHGTEPARFVNLTVGCMAETRDAAEAVAAAARTALLAAGFEVTDRKGDSDNATGLLVAILEVRLFET